MPLFYTIYTIITQLFRIIHKDHMNTAIVATHFLLPHFPLKSMSGISNLTAASETNDAAAFYAICCCFTKQPLLNIHIQTHTHIYITLSEGCVDPAPQVDGLSGISSAVCLCLQNMTTMELTFAANGRPKCRQVCVCLAKCGCEAREQQQSTNAGGIIIGFGAVMRLATTKDVFTCPPHKNV